MPRSAKIDMPQWTEPRARKNRRSPLQVVRRETVSAEEQFKKRLWWRRALLILGMILVTTLPAGWLIKRYAQSFAVQAVTIEGEFHNQQAYEVEQALLPYVKGDFFTADLANARKALLNIAWIRDVSLRRAWPNRISVKIEEQIPVAIWNRNEFLNDSAGIFKHQYINKTEPLPELAGPEGYAQQVLSQFYLWREAFALVGLPLQGVRLSEHNSWTLTTAQGISIDLGEERIEMRVQRFLSVFPKHLQSRIGHIRKIDLRYSNGFAVGWNDSLNDTEVENNRDV